MDLRGNVCVVTGASSGIGRRIAVDLASAGAVVCAVARRESRLRALVDELDPTTGDHGYVVADVSDRDQVRGVAAHVRREHGRADILVNAAGFTVQPQAGELLDVAAIEQVMATNFFGAVYCTAEMLPLLKASAPSHVVNIASIAGRLAVGGSPGYCASKFALSGFSESLYFDLAPSGVWVSLVEPGPVPTEGFPMWRMARHPIFRFATGSKADVSKAVMNAIRRRRMHRVVPRVYYVVETMRWLVPPLYRKAGAAVYGRARKLEATAARRGSDGIGPENDERDGE